MPFFTRCPYCKHGVRAPDRAMAGSVKCPGCASWYTAVAEDEPAQPEAARSSLSGSPTVPRAAPAPAKAGAESSTSPPAVAIPPKPPPPAINEVPLTVPLVADDEDSDDGPAAGGGAPSSAAKGGPPVLGVVACLLAAAALLAASTQSTAVLTRPLAGAGLLIGFAGALAVGGGRPQRLILPGGGAAVCGVALAVALFFPALLGPRYESSRAKSDYDPDAVRVVPLELRSGAEGLEVEGHADAGRAAVQQGGIRARVVAATVGPVRLADVKKRFTRPLLAITVQVQHLGHGKSVPFVHWGLPAGRDVPQATATVNGRRLGIPDLGADLPQGVSHGRELFPGRPLSDLLVFDAVSGQEPVRLELPAEAWGGRGVFRFHIPSSMIVVSGKHPR